MLRQIELVFAGLLALSLVGCGITEKEQTDRRSNEAMPEPTTDGSGLNLPGVPSANGQFRLGIDWLKPVDFEDEDNRCRLVFFTADGKAATTVENVSLRPWMTSMGHGTYEGDLELEAEADRPEAVLVTGLVFTMGGAWDLQIKAVVNGQTDEVTVTIDVPK